MPKHIQVWDPSDTIGPFDLGLTPECIPRHFGCPNYDACLGFAARCMWDSFGCDGCRRTTHGTFVEEKGLWSCKNFA